MEEDSLPPPSQVSTRRSKRGRPPKPKPNDTVSEHRENSLDAPKRPKSKRSRFQQGTSSVAQQASDLTLIEAIKGNGKLIPHVVKLWVERYEMEPKPAMDELLTMLFQACGAKDYNKADLVDEIDVDDVVVALVNCAISGEIEDYHNSKKEFKNFKENLESFWHNLVCECQHGPLFDQVLFDKCMDYITALSCTPPRVYRQVASLMGLELVTSYITIANMLGGQRETTRRQLDAEKKKRNERPLLESLNKRFSDTHEKITLLEEMMRKIFTGLFVHRYRDIDPTIRKSCIQSLGLWVLSYPSLFLQDLYLKYLGWALNDRNAGVRKTSIKALENLYEADDNVPSLGLFTERFSRRMIEITDDIDVSVAVCAVGLVKQLLRHQLIPEDDLAPLYDLLAVDPPEIRHAIGALVYDHLIAQKFNSSQSASRGETDNSSEVHLKRMLRILEEFPQNPILSIYVIDDVWDYMKAIKDWKCIASMLLDENPLIELSDRDVSNLVRLLCASVKKAVGERIIPVTDDRKQYHNRAQKEAYESNKQDITVALMKSYPLLLRKFISDKEKVSSLVEIILYMDLDLYSLKRQEQSFKNILQLIKEAFFKHGDKDTLRACVKAIDFCCEETEGELQDIAHNKVKELEDEFILKLKSAIKVVVDGGDEYSLLVNSKRLYELHLLIYVPIDNNLYDDIVMVLRGFRNMEDEVVGFLLLSMYLHMAWGLLSIINEEVVYEASLASLLYKRDTLLQELEYFCNLGTDSKEGGKQGSELACRVCIIFSEIWFLFRRENFFETPLERLLYEPNEYVLRKFWKLCEQLLNVSEEEEDEYINREYFEETNRYIVIIAAIKLVAFDAVPKEYLASEIISHFVMHGTSVAEIVKHLITLLKEKDDDLAAILLKALKKAYHRRVVDISGPETDSSDSTSLSGCKDLAAELSGTFIGAELVKHKAVILEIVREGIEYAFVDAPTQLSFLEAAVLQFVPKLPASDVLEIMDDVQKRTENVNTEEDPSGWRPYHTFISLLEKYVNNDVNQEEIEGASVSRKGHPRKPQNMEGKKLFDDQSSSDDEDSLSEYEDVHDEEEGSQEEEDEDEDSPFIFSIKSSSKLMSLGNKGQTKAGTSVSAVDDLSASKTSGASN
ncbi:PREDICTED: sister-chromatid cohesion protein 3-like isoform X1 [Lupinus angustifolius]|uniref:sister-chromatid cohesion protein 3-like isoform X1 n=2 Tax=Lupinus angustifolius TaxID=3871 RepID=UPI00092F1C04|nr:PREDICTED: sister-chromatid cohesion protein 3-like isoform X1 [Lupinus angustifolius]